MNGDGQLDILSGSYSRMTQDMAGLFQVLWGEKGGTFRAAEALKGTDGEPLIIPADKENVTDKICTRPTAVDLDGDGKLDIVAGNFTGTFAVFRGAGKGRFAPKPTWLEADGEKLRVDAHSDPFFFDWDADGDLDLISGASRGGVYLFLNKGSAKEPKFHRLRKELVPPARPAQGTRFGDAHLTGPQSGTRVWIDDVNGDGRFDLLIGDNASVSQPAGNLSQAEALAKLKVWQTKMVELNKELNSGGDRKAAMKRYTAHWKAREKIVATDNTGFVWVMLQKAATDDR